MKRKGPAKKQFMVKRPDPTARRDATVTQDDFDMTEEIQTLQKTRQVNEAEKQEQAETYSHHSEPQAVWDGANTRRVAVARPVVEAWQSPDGGTFGEEVKTKVAPQNLVLGGHDQGPRRNHDGGLIGYSILGNPSDYEERAPTQQHQAEEQHAFVPPGMVEESESVYGSQSSKQLSVASGRTGMSIRSRKSAGGQSVRSGASRSGKSQHGGSQRGSQRGGSHSGEPMQELSYYERSAEQRQTRALERHAAIEREREKLYENFMKNRKGMPGNPVMFTGDEYRERREEYDLIDKAQPREEKFRDNLWFMSLRDSWCRYIPLGSIFSGLFCKVHEKDLSEKAFTVVRDPTKPSMVLTRLQKTNLRDGTEYKYHTSNEADSIPKLSWVNDQHMWDAQNHHKKAIKELLPFRVDTEGLMVSGEDIWSNEREGVDPDALQKLEGDASLGEDKAGRRPDGSIHSHVTGSKVAMATEAGPMVTFAQSHLAFESNPGSVASQRLPVTNTGTTAIYYKWHKAEQENKLGVPLRGIDPPGGGFYSVEEEGVLLPGNTQEFSFAFKSQLCGIYTASFHMTTQPPVAEDVPLNVTMRGVVTQPDENGIKRQLLEEHLEHNSVVHGIQDMIMEAIRQVTLPPPAAGAEDQPQDTAKIDAKIFAKANTEILIKGDVPCVRTQTVFYDKYLLSEMRDLAQVARDLPQLGDLPPKEPTPDADAAFLKTLTPREAVYDPSVEKDSGASESWEEEWSWSHNVLHLGTRQLGIVSEEQRTDELGKLDGLVERAVWHPHRPNQLYPPALDAMSELAENIEATAAQTRRRMGLPAVAFQDPDAEPAAGGKDAKKGDADEEAPDPELEKDYRDALYSKVRQLLCDAVDQFADLATVVVMDEAERRGEDTEEV